MIKHKAVCSDCLFFIPSSVHIENKGQCRRKAPISLEETYWSGQGSDIYQKTIRYTGFPDTYPNNWCGEYKKNDRPKT